MKKNIMIKKIVESRNSLTIYKNVSLRNPKTIFYNLGDKKTP